MNPHIVLNFNLSSEAGKAFESQMISVTSGQLPTPLSSLAGVSPEAVSASLPTPSAHAGGISAVVEAGLPTPFGPGAAATSVEDASALLPTPMMNAPFAAAGASFERMPTPMDYAIPPATSTEGAQGTPTPFDKPESMAAESH